MPAFGSPFSGLANDRKLNDEELVRAIRFMVAAEYEATQLYTQLPDGHLKFPHLWPPKFLQG
jgi:hypothetical protein